MLRRKASGFSHAGHGDITGSQWFVIRYIFQNEGTSTNEVAEALDMSGSAVTQLVNGLVKKGYIKRKSKPTDRRASTLMLSLHSRKKIQDFKKKRIVMMLHMFTALTDAEFKQYVALNKKIFTSLTNK